MFQHTSNFINNALTSVTHVFENLLSIAFYNASTYCRCHMLFICNC